MTASGGGRRLLVVPPEAAGTRLDSFVAGADLALSRSQVRHLIDDGRVTIGGRARKAGQVVRAGEQVEIDVPVVTTTIAEPEALPLDVLHEDASIVVINKAPGMVVHPAPGRWRGTVVNALLHRFGAMPGHETSRPGIVHRLDRDTSGVMVIARTTVALEHLARQFASRTVRKRYLAVVRGTMRAETIHIDAAIGRHASERKKMSIRARVARAAVTRVRVLERFTGATFVEAMPETGRTHQIRVHLASRGHPVIGDALYGRPRPHEETWIARHALHAAELGFVHPTLDVPMTFAADLWPDMHALLAMLRVQRDT